MKISIGPVSARFASTLTLADVVQPSSCTHKFAGQGGVAGFGRGEANVRLAPEAGGTKLDWDADAHVGGKLAQIGSRLIEATVRKMSDDFFVRFANQLNQVPADALVTPAALEATPSGAAGKPIAIVVAIVVCIVAAVAWWMSR